MKTLPDGWRFVGATLVGLALYAFGVSAAAAQPSAGLIAIQLFSDVPRQPSEVFAAAIEPAFEIAAWLGHPDLDRTPHRVAPTIETVVTVPPNWRVILAGNADGTAPFSIDNFLLFEIGNGGWTFVIGATNPVFYLGPRVGEIIAHVGPTPYIPVNAEPSMGPIEALDLTSVFPSGEPTPIRVFALIMAASVMSAMSS